MDVPAYHLELVFSCGDCGAPTKRRVCKSCQEYARIIPADTGHYDELVYGDCEPDDSGDIS